MEKLRRPHRGQMARCGPETSNPLLTAECISRHPGYVINGVDAVKLRSWDSQSEETIQQVAVG